MSSPLKGTDKFSKSIAKGEQLSDNKGMKSAEGVG